MPPELKSPIAQVTNISPTVTNVQINTLFAFLGDIEELEMYPKTASASAKVAFVRFKDISSVGVSQHLTNTVFIDRPIVCIPYSQTTMPDEATAMQFVTPVRNLITLYHFFYCNFIIFRQNHRIKK